MCWPLPTWCLGSGAAALSPEAGCALQPSAAGQPLRVTRSLQTILGPWVKPDSPRHSSVPISPWSLYKERLDLNSHSCSREVVPCAYKTPQARAHHIGCTEQSAPWAIGHTLCSFLEVLIQLLFPQLTGPKRLVELVTNLSLTRILPLFLMLTVLSLSPQSVPRLLFSDLVLWTYHHLVFYQGWKTISKITFIFPLVSDFQKFFSSSSEPSGLLLLSTFLNFVFKLVSYLFFSF